MLDLRTDSSPDWLEAVMSDFDAFLIDHAACERKASSMALTFVVRYPDRTGLVEAMIEVAREELEHFDQVVQLIHGRGLRLGPDSKDPYINRLMKAVRTTSDERFMDRLILGGVVEGRGCERFGLIAEALLPGPEKDFYADLTRSEARHHGLFIRMARQFFPDDAVTARLEQFLDLEAEALAAVPPRPALH